MIKDAWDELLIIYRVSVGPTRLQVKGLRVLLLILLEQFGQQASSHFPVVGLPISAFPHIPDLNEFTHPQFMMKASKHDCKCCHHFA